MENIKYIDAPSKVDDALTELHGYPELGFDTETTGLDPLTDKVLLLQVGTPTVQFVFNVHEIGHENTMRVLHLLKQSEVTKVAHNAKFDYTMIKSNYGVDLPNIVCTMIGSMLLTKGIVSADNSLDGCLTKYLGMKMNKAKQKSFIDMKVGDSFTWSQILYAAKDVEMIIPLKNKIVDLLNERGMKQLSELEFETVRVCGDMQLNGIYLDGKKWLALLDDAKAMSKKAKAELDEHVKDHAQLDIFGVPTVNYASPLQLKPLIEKITGKALESTGVRDLERIDHPMVKSLLNFREAHKKVTTYGASFLQKHVHKKTKRVHSNFKQLGTDSGRMSSSSPNMQNIPSAQKYRSCFTNQKPGYKIISADFSGQELRLLAHISQEQAFIKALNENKDLHSYSASLIFGVPYEDFFYYGKDGIREACDDNDSLDPFELSLDSNQNDMVVDNVGDPLIRPEMKKKYRTPCKSITFGLIYGMGASKLADTLKITIAEAKELIGKYFDTFPTIRDLLDRLTQEAMARKYAYSPLDGRRRIFSGIDWDHGGKVAHMKNIAKNQPFQGAGASVTKLALCRMKHRIDSTGWDAKIINVVHDEILIEVLEEQAEEVAKALEEIMKESFNFYAPDIPMVAKAEIANEWRH